jgi:hypothetical protein
MRLRKLAALAACAVVTGLALGATTASADPTAEHNKNAGVFSVKCPGMEPFQVSAVGAVGFVEGGTVLVINQFPGQGSLDLVACQATGDAGTFTVNIQFVQRG